jgi:mannose-6-phosphate isomerase-like protein (cupin superfamily)
MSDYTIIELDEVPDFSGDAPFEMRGYTRPLGTEQLALTHIRIPPGTPLAPPGFSPAFGHHHKTQEEIYYVLSGTATLKLDDDIVELGRRCAVRMAPATKRSVRNLGDDDLEMLLLSVKVADLREEVVMHHDFWPS